MKPKREIIVVLDNVRSALNVGAIFRTCDAAGVSKLFLCGITPFPPHPKVLKTALGAEEFVDYTYEKEVMKTIDYLLENDFTIISIEQTKESKIYTDIKFPNKIALVFGNEITGVQKAFLDKSKLHVELPMVGRKESLNVATTAGIMLYHTAFVN